MGLKLIKGSNDCEGDLKETIFFSDAEPISRFTVNAESTFEADNINTRDNMDFPDIAVSVWRTLIVIAGIGYRSLARNSNIGAVTACDFYFRLPSRLESLQDQMNGIDISDIVEMEGVKYKVAGVPRFIKAVFTSRCFPVNGLLPDISDYLKELNHTRVQSDSAGRWGHFLVYASKGKIFLTAAEKSKEICPERLEELGHVKSVFPGRILWYSNRHKHYEEILSSGAYDNI